MELEQIEISNKTVFSGNASLKEYAIRIPFEVEKKIIQNHLSKDGNILDIGCASGGFSSYLKKSGYDVTGIDIVPEMLELARERVKGVCFRLMNACHLDFDPESFDNIIFAYNGIDYIFPARKRNLCLKEIYRILKKGGVFAFSSHNSLCLSHFFPNNKFRLINLILNLKRKNIFQQYRFEKHPSGILQTYVANPFSQKVQLRAIGFKDIKTYGQKYNHPLFKNFFETWIYYVCWK